MIDSASARKKDDREFLPLAVGLPVFIPLVLAANVLGALVRYPEFGSSIVLSPYALVTAALVVTRRRDWVWYILVAAVARAVPVSGWPLTWVIAADLANMLRAVMCAALLRWTFRGLPRLSDTMSLLRFMAIAVVLAPAVAALLGAANMKWHDASSSFAFVWTVWFVPNALMGLTMLPGLFAAAQLRVTGDRTPITRARALESIALAVMVGALCGWGLWSSRPTPGGVYLFLFASLPLFIWAGLRFGIGGASLALTVVTTSGIVATAPIIGSQMTSLDGGLIALQMFQILLAAPLLGIAAIGSARLGAVRLYRALMASFHDQVAILDANGMVLEVNRSWDQFAGEEHDCPLDRVRAGDDYLAECRRAIVAQREAGMADADGIAPRALVAVEAVLNGTEKRFTAEYEQGGRGTGKWFDLQIEALDRPEGGVVITRSDTSARHRAQLELEMRRQEVSHLARVHVLGQMSGTMAHELMQPIATIQMNAESELELLRDESTDIASVQASLESIAKQARQASRVIRGLRAMLKRGEPHVRSVDAAALVTSVMELARPELDARHIAVTVAVDPGLAPIIADEVQAQQVLLNLLLNACEAMDTVAVPERSIALSVRADSDMLRMSVSDSGSGIPAHLFGRLFEPFVTTKEEGLGLGLSISRTIVNAHGGRFWAENNPTRGATFHCEFRTAPASADFAIVAGAPHVLANAPQATEMRR